MHIFIIHARIENLVAWNTMLTLRFIFLTSLKENNMKYPLLAAALLALTVSACDGKKEAAAPASEPVAIPAEQAPVQMEEAPPVAEEPPAVDAAPVPAEEAPAPVAEEPAAPAVETK
jgi:hypothetical protein